MKYIKTDEEFNNNFEKGNKCEPSKIANVFRTQSYRPNDEDHHNYMITENNDIKNYTHDELAEDDKLKNISYTIDLGENISGLTLEYDDGT